MADAAEATPRAQLCLAAQQRQLNAREVHAFTGYQWNWREGITQALALLTAVALVRKARP